MKFLTCLFWKKITIFCIFKGYEKHNGTEIFIYILIANNANLIEKIQPFFVVKTIFD